MQRTLARRVAEAKATVPEHWVQAEIDMEACAELRGRLAARGGGAATPTYEDLLVRACGVALRDVPEANGAYRDGRFELYDRVNVGLVMATADAFVTPTIFDADRADLDAIAARTRALAELARDGSITQPDLSGATFTVCALDVDAWTAIVSPPQAAVLAVGAVAPRAVVRDGAVVARRTLVATLTCDHRVLYGPAAVRLLHRIRALLEQPRPLEP